MTQCTISSICWDIVQLRLLLGLVDTQTHVPESQIESITRKNPYNCALCGKGFISKKPQSIYQGSFDHVKVGPTPILELHNLWLQIHMFLAILEFRVENKKIFRKKLFL